MARLSEIHFTQRVGWLRASVLGANDGIVSTASLIVGVAAAEAGRSNVLVAGVAGLVAGAMSMAAGEYVSVSSQSDTERADLERERNELATDAEGEHAELAAIYVTRGLDPELAKQVATQLTAKDACPSPENSMSIKKMTFHVEARRVDAHGSLAHCKNAEIALDTDMAGNPDAFNPAELLLAALSACIIKGIERVAPLLDFSLRGIGVKVDGVRQDAPPLMESIHYEIIVDTDEPDHRLELLHDNVEKYGTVFNTLAPGTTLNGVLRRKVAQ